MVIETFGEVLYEGGPYTDGTDGELVSAEFCLEEGCYQFGLRTTTKICCDYGEGSWTIVDPNGMAVGTGDTTVAENLQFCADESLGLLCVTRNRCWPPRSRLTTS